MSDPITGVRGRLAATPAARGCLDLATLYAADDGGEGTLAGIRAALQRADAALAERFWAGDDVDPLVRTRAWVVEQLLLFAWDRIVAPDGRAALVAVGGFGRGELHPHSDVDLLVLLKSAAQRKAMAPRLERFVTLLWDAGFYLGHSVRTVRECRREAADDLTVITTLMEARLMSGDARLFADMLAATGRKKIWTGREFFEAKCEEQRKRHAQFHETAYNLEPNIKEGPGGLRDIQTIAWVAKRHFGAQTLHGLVDHGYLTAHEHDQLLAGQRFLWRVRYALHLLAGRAEDRLLFDHQPKIAERFGYPGEEGSNLAVEAFMQDYYRNVMQLERLNERLLQLFAQAFLPRGAQREKPLGDDFVVRGGWLEVRDERLFLTRPAALMELFVTLAGRDDIHGVGAATIRLIRDHLHLVDARFRADPEVLALFYELLCKPSGVYTQLQRMNRYGVLAAFLPAFGHIVGRMQFDLFHVYTVDQHTLFVIRNLRRFAYGKYRDEFPHGPDVFERIDRPSVLYLAALFHDIAKGRGGDHSELGAVDSRAFCAALPMPEEDRELVAWLVERHLVMSQTAQRRDIGDPRTIADFREVVGDRRRLDHLYLLTMADIAGTSPKLWNGWKDGLLWELYVATARALDEAFEVEAERRERMDRRRTSNRRKLIEKGFDAGAIDGLWETLPDTAFLRFSPARMIWGAGKVLGAGAEVVVAVRRIDKRDVSEVLVSAPDYDGLFASVTAVFDEMGLNVLTARVLTTRDERSFDLFELQDRRGLALNTTDEATLERRLSAVLRERRVAGPVRRKVPRRLRPFLSAPEVAFGQVADSPWTRVVIKCSDRPGLLSQIAATMFDQGLRVHDARIATFGDRVEDTFMVSDRDDLALDGEATERLGRALGERLSES